MTEDWMQAHGDVVAPDAEFAFDTGWLPLVESAVARIRTYPTAWGAKLNGGKEKLGCLVLFLACDYGQRGCRSEVERLLEEIRLRSLASCEICGGQGRLRLSGYAQTLCDQHSTVMIHFRDDDGAHADPWRWREEQPIKERIADVIATGRAVMAAAEESALGKRIDDDSWQRRGREQELLIEFGRAIEDAVNGAAVKDEYLDDYIAAELDGWRTTAVVPVSESDRKFLHGYLRELIDREYERVRQKREAERDTN